MSELTAQGFWGFGVLGFWGEKDKEVERQVADLVQRGMVEPADGAWSSPVVLVRKKD